MTALMLKNPGKIFRGSVLVLQGRLLCHVYKEILLLSLFSLFRSYLIKSGHWSILIDWPITLIVSLLEVYIEIQLVLMVLQCIQFYRIKHKASSS